MIVLENKEGFKKFNLRCKTCKTCPDLTFDVENDLVKLEDDHGNTNRWTMENFRELAFQIKEGSFDEYLEDESTDK